MLIAERGIIFSRQAARVSEQSRAQSSSQETHFTCQHMWHIHRRVWKHILPGICFAVVFSGNNILKELPTSNPRVQKNKGGYRVHARLAQGCMGHMWPSIWALPCSLCRDLRHRGARAVFHHHCTSSVQDTVDTLGINCPCHSTELSRY